MNVCCCFRWGHTEISRCFRICFPISAYSKFQAKAHKTSGCIARSDIHYFEYASRYRSVCHWNALSSVNSNESEHSQLSICCWDTWKALNPLQVNQQSANTRTHYSPYVCWNWSVVMIMNSVHHVNVVFLCHYFNLHSTKRTSFHQWWLRKLSLVPFSRQHRRLPQIVKQKRHTHTYVHIVHKTVLYAIFFCSCIKSKHTMA